MLSHFLDSSMFIYTLQNGTVAHKNAIFAGRPLIKDDERWLSDIHEQQFYTEKGMLHHLLAQQQHANYRIQGYYQWIF